MYTVVGGNPFTMHTGTTTFTGLRVVGTTGNFKDMRRLVEDNWDNCSGLILVLYNGKEISYNKYGEMVHPT